MIKLRDIKCDQSFTYNGHVYKACAYPRIGLWTFRLDCVRQDDASPTGWIIKDIVGHKTLGDADVAI